MIDIDKLIQDLKLIDKQYDALEDKQYYLFHSFVDMSLSMNQHDLKAFKEAVFKEFESDNYLIFRDYIFFIDGKTEYPIKEIEKKEIKTDLNIIDFYQQYDVDLLNFLKGCLFIENALNQILQKLKKSTNRTFHNKITILFDNKRISVEMKNLLIHIKDVRNEIAHNLFYELDYDTVYNLVKESVDAGVIYSDDCIWKNYRLSYEFYGLSGSINELFPNIFSSLIECDSDLLAIDESSKMLC